MQYKRNISFNLFLLWIWCFNCFFSSNMYSTEKFSYKWGAVWKITFRCALCWDIITQMCTLLRNYHPVVQRCWEIITQMCTLLRNYHPVAQCCWKIITQIALYWEIVIKICTLLKKKVIQIYTLLRNYHSDVQLHWEISIY